MGTERILLNRFFDNAVASNEFENFILSTLKERESIINCYFNSDIDRISCLEFVKYMLAVEMEIDNLFKRVKTNDDFTEFYIFSFAKAGAKGGGHGEGLHETYSIDDVKQRVILSSFRGMSNAISILQYHTDKLGFLYDAVDAIIQIDPSSQIYREITRTFPFLEENLQCLAPSGYCSCEFTPQTLLEYFPIDLESLFISKSDFDENLPKYENRVNVGLHKKAAVRHSDNSIKANGKINTSQRKKLDLNVVRDFKEELKLLIGKKQKGKVRGAYLALTKFLGKVDPSFNPLQVNANREEVRGFIMEQCRGIDLPRVDRIKEHLNAEPAIVYSCNRINDTKSIISLIIEELK